MRPVPLILALAACGPSDDPVAPIPGALGTEPISVDGAWTRPEALLGPQGLGHHDWTEADLQGFTAAWPVPTAIVNPWISTGDGPSVRTHVLRAPDVAQQLTASLKTTRSGDHPLHDALAAQSPWLHRDGDLSALRADAYSPPVLPLDEPTHALYRALAGARGDSEDAEVDEILLARADAWPEAAQLPLARLVIALQEAPLRRDEAFAQVDPDRLARIRAQLQDETFTTIDNAYAHPRGGDLLADLEAISETVELRPLMGAALALARAVDEVQAALATVPPFEGGDLEVETAAGTVILRSAAVDDTWESPTAALIVDLGGDDTWSGRVGSTWDGQVAARVVVDVRGRDTWGTGIPDLQDPDTSVFAAFDPEPGFTQGSGVTGIGLVSDGAGEDDWRATVHAQGSGLLGIGILDDRGGSDTYRVSAHGQGVGHLGLGLLRDVAGDDDYRGYTVIQGVGKPGGEGLLLDEAGTDTYVALVQQQDPWLPAEYAAPNYFRLPASWAYGIDGTPHYMSVAQGTGWGFRHEWVRSWTGEAVAHGGGLGALVDLGDGDDVHVADCMSMGQGFVYGMGLLYDDGGDDTYRTFWWGPGASAHMGVGLHWDRDGNDDIYTTRASAGFGYDFGVGWMIDEGGDDVYGGQVHYGRGYLNSHTFFVNIGGDDTYNAEGVRRDPYFGVVRQIEGGRRVLKLAGVFLDLGGGEDTYVTGVEGPGNGATWYHAPLGDSAVPANHKGVGVDE